MSMRRLGGAAALLVLGLTVALRAADDGTAAASNHWYDGLNLFGPKKSDAPQLPPVVPVSANAAVGMPVAQRSAPNMKTVNQDWLRRSEVCQRLKEIARDTHDDALWEQVEALQFRIDDVHNKCLTDAAMRLRANESVASQRDESGRRGVAPVKEKADLDAEGRE